ncbi:hypothetical protein HDR61_04245 [bacterium]|nr:hypothetical protein [bacterium]
MHVKYASRHELYPVPKLVVVAARATVALRAARALADVVAADAGVRTAALDFCVADIALREDVVFTIFVVRAARVVTFDFARDCVAARVATDVVRDVGVVLRALCMVVPSVLRGVLDALRTAALETPMPANKNAAKSTVLFIIAIL